MAGPRAVIVVAADAREAVAEFGKLQASFNTTKDHALSLSNVMSGIGQGIGIAGVLSVANAAGTLRDVLADSVRAAMEDERSVVRLGVALRDNVAAWSGNTEAIEKAVAARTRLGFEDDVLRQSLGTLVARTHDVNRALQLMDQAMDLARFRGIDLAAATDLIGKAFDGNIGALRRAGIAVKEHATAQEALKAVLKSTGGQAEAYATTSLGKLERAEIRAKEASEKLGRSIAPFVAEAADKGADALDLLAFSLSGWEMAIRTLLGGPARDFYNATTAQTNATKLAHDALASYTGEVDIAAAHMVGAASAAQQLAWSLNLVRINADPATSAVKTNAAGSWTAQTAQLALAAGLDQASVGATKLRTTITSTTTATGGLSRAADDLSSKMRDKLAKSFDTFKTSAIAALDAVHAKKLRAIEDARRLRDAELEAQAAAIQGTVDAERKKLEEARDARRQRELEQAVAEAAAAGDMEAMAAAQANLADFLEEQRIEKMQAEADAQIAAIDKERQANDQKAQDLTDAENERYDKLKTALDKQLKLLGDKLEDGNKAWRVHMATVIDILEKSGAEFAKQGENLGAIFGDKIKAGLGGSIIEIAKLMADLLGISLSEEEVAKFKAQLGFKAAGGYVAAGSPYVVGERGPELFVPGSSGTIVPNDRLVAGGGSTAVNVTISGPAVFDPLGVAAQQLAALLIPAINRERTRQGTM